MEYLQNLHTHSTFCDGKDTPEEMIEKAIELGFDSLGFSGHSYIPGGEYYCMKDTHGYKAKINQLKEKYKDKIEIFCGIEFEMHAPKDLDGYDYVIGSSHYIKIGDEVIDIDLKLTPFMEILQKYFDGNGMMLARAYYENIAKMPEYIIPDFIGHFDIVRKHSEKANIFDTKSKEYKNYALEALFALSEKNDFFELNTGCISRGYLSTPYPQKFILEELKNLNKKIIITSDCHNKDFLGVDFKLGEELLKSVGFHEVYVLKKSGFVPVKL